MELETPRLIMRRFRDGDLDAWAALCAIPEVIRFASFDGRPKTREQSAERLRTMMEHWVEHGYGLWAVEEKASGRFIGRIGLHFPPGFPETEVAWMLAPEYWGRGLAAEGARAAIEYGFAVLGRTKLISLIYPQNEPSIRLAERLGETCEGDFEIGGLRLLIYSIRREEWRTSGHYSQRRLA